MLTKPKHGKTPIGAYYSPGVFNDGGGIIIYPGKDGKLHVKIVPPRELVLESFNLIAQLVSLAETSGDANVSRELSKMADSILQRDGAKISAQMGEMGT